MRTVNDPTDESLVVRWGNLPSEEGMALDGRGNHIVELVLGVVTK